MRRVTLSLNRDRRNRLVDLTQIIGSQLHIGRAQVFFEAMKLCRSRDRHDPGFLGEEPGEGDLSAGDLLQTRSRTLMARRSSIAR
jgi:hypothetical protein